MKAVPFVLAALQGIVIGGCAMSERPQVAPYEAVHEYRLAPGDQIRVVVFDQPTLSASYSIDASGTVSIPLAGAFKAENKTVRQIESSIGKALKDKNLVADPKVTVEVAIYRPFSILGEVRAPGRFPYAPGMTIEAAVALAGGYTIHADQDRIRVTSRVDDALVTDYRQPTEIFLPGDTLYVTERWF